MVHSVELLLDPQSESAIRKIWDQLSGMGLRSPRPDSRPHVTLVVSEHLPLAVDALLGPLCGRLPVGCVVGAPMLFGSASLILVRLVVPSAQLLEIHREAHRICAPHATPRLADNSAPGRWTPHVTLARRVDPAELARVMTNRRIGRDIDARVVGLRHWDGTRRLEHVIDPPRST